MHRKKILSLLSDYRERYPKEMEVVERMTQFVSDNSDCFERSLQIGHITGSAWVVSPDFSETLMTHHKKLNIWIQLGGHADGDSDVSNVAMREAVEESGIDDIKLVSDQIFDIDVHEIPAFGEEPAHYHYDVRFLLQTAHKDFKVSKESKALAWISSSQLGKYSEEESILRMQRKWMSLAGKISN